MENDINKIVDFFKEKQKYDFINVLLSIYNKIEIINMENKKYSKKIINFIRKYNINIKFIKNDNNIWTKIKYILNKKIAYNNVIIDSIYKKYNNNEDENWYKIRKNKNQIKNNYKINKKMNFIFQKLIDYWEENNGYNKKIDCEKINFKNIINTINNSNIEWNKDKEKSFIYSNINIKSKKYKILKCINYCNNNYKLLISKNSIKKKFNNKTYNKVKNKIYETTVNNFNDTLKKIKNKRFEYNKNVKINNLKPDKFIKNIKINYSPTYNYNISIKKNESLNYIEKNILNKSLGPYYYDKNNDYKKNFNNFFKNH